MIIVFFAFLVISAFSSHYEVLFQEFLEKYKKQYSSNNEREKRFEIFKENIKKSRELELINPSAKWGDSPFMDLTASEFSSQNLMMEINRKEFESKNTEDFESCTLPLYFDWTDKGAVTSIKNQGSCGSCWDFAAVASAEGQLAIKKGKLLSLSEQQVLDCGGSAGSCKGGYPVRAFKYIIQNGLEKDVDYPYKPVQGKCKYKKSLVNATFDNWFSIKESSTSFMCTIMQNGPISVCFDAHCLHTYHSGVVQNGCGCSQSTTNHCVSIVGFGNSTISGKNVDYYKVKNSWGKIWGEEGFFRISRGKNTCNIECCGSSINIK